MKNDFKKKVRQISEMAYKDQVLCTLLTSAASAGQLAEICRAQGVELSQEEEEEAFVLLQGYLAENRTRILSDEELERVAAGSQDDYDPAPIEDCHSKG
ncbi:MAG: hypothetical protein ACOX4L_03820 [Bacillota bacterium]|jgi:hypothetical protein